MTLLFKCPECGGRMQGSQLLSSPPIEEQECTKCGVLYRKHRRMTMVDLPLDEYERMGKTK